MKNIPVNLINVYNNKEIYYYKQIKKPGGCGEIREKFDTRYSNKATKITNYFASRLAELTCFKGSPGESAYTNAPQQEIACFDSVGIKRLETRPNLLSSGTRGAGTPPK